MYDNPHNYNGLSLIVATVFFAFQIYCDFSGYSDIAIGAARTMGFKLMKNFDIPYYSKSISEFWKKWHISLSTWLKDYLYISLGGNRVPRLRGYLNLFIIFLVSGLWHGAAWTYICWGVIHGFYMIGERIIQEFKNKFFNKVSIRHATFFTNFLKGTITFALVNISWIFFRANSVDDAWFILKKIFLLDVSGTSIFSANKNQLVISFFVIILMECVHLIQRKMGADAFLSKLPIAARWAIYLAVLAMTLALGEFRAQDFIYFQF